VAVFAWAAEASAQVTSTGVQVICPTPGPNQVTTTETSTASSDGVTAAFVSTPTDQCYFVVNSPLGQNDCTSPRDLPQLAWSISPTEAATGGNFQIFAWNVDNSCATATPTEYFYNQVTTDVQLSFSPFPSGLYTSAIPYTTKSIMDSGGCCSTGVSTGGSSSGSTSGDTTDDPSAVGGPCDGKLFNMCVVVENANVTPPGAANAYLQFYVDTVPPAQVTGVTASPGDGRAILNWTVDASIDVSKYVVTISDASGKVLQTPGTTAGTGTTVTSIAVENLTNGVQYFATVSAFDFANNQGPPSSPPLSFTPQDQCDFWECYGGKEKGGFCFIGTAAYGSYDASTVQIFRDFRDRVLLKFSTGQKLVLWYYAHGARPAVWLAQHEWARRGAAIALWPVAIAAALVVRAGVGSFMLICAALVFLFVGLRRARAAWLVLALLAITAPAHAEDGFDDSGFQDNVDHSGDIPADEIKPRPRWGAGFKLGPYRPNIDSDPAALGVYKNYFGQSSAVAVGAGRKLLFMAEGDVYLYRGIGLLGISGSAAYWIASAKSKVCQDTAENKAVTCTPADATGTVPGVTVANGGDGTDFNMVPLSISAVYKFDYFYQRWHVPLTPMVRAGFDGVFWWIDGSGRQAIGRQGQKGYGLTTGYHVRPGFELNLDFLEPDTARRAFESSGIFSTALTFEWIFNSINNFGSPHSWDLSDSTFLAGFELNL
jgi:hypothetical protein